MADLVKRRQGRYLGMSEAVGRHDPARSQGTSDRGAADRVLAVDARSGRQLCSRPAASSASPSSAYSPLGRGFLTGQIKKVRRPRRRRLPAHEPALSGRQLRREPRARQSASRSWRSRRATRPASSRSRGCSHRATTSCRFRARSGRTYLEENLGATQIMLSRRDLASMDEIAPKGAAAGERYPTAGMSSVNR